jgi:hypothetical protein
MILVDMREPFAFLIELESLRQDIIAYQEKVDRLAYPPTDIIDRLLGLFFHAGQTAVSLRLPATMRKVEYLNAAYTGDSPIRNALEILSDLEHLRHDLISEATAIQFLYLKPERLKFLDSDSPFGQNVVNAFPSAVLDMREASNCYALERWPACVFHLMRVLEFGLTAMADKFAVTIGTSTWHVIIEAIEERIRRMDSITYGNTWRQQQKDFSDAATQFMFFKDAWRNHIMHVRDVYDEGRATSILQHAEEFMKKLVGIGLCEVPKPDRS